MPHDDVTAPTPADLDVDLVAALTYLYSTKSPNTDWFRTGQAAARRAIAAERERDAALARERVLREALQRLYDEHRQFWKNGVSDPVGDMLDAALASAPAQGEACDHDKCYSPYVLTSNPPQYPWICRKCKVEGRDVGVPFHNGEEYARLKKQKEGEGK
jgi:hypothetical protein